jgi:hypothetical protein
VKVGLNANKIVEERLCDMPPKKRGCILCKNAMKNVVECCVKVG